MNRTRTGWVPDQETVALAVIMRAVFDRGMTLDEVHAIACDVWAAFQEDTGGPNV